MNNKIIKGDCIEEMKKLEPNSVDAIITDPPYGLEFMGKEWDKFKHGNTIINPQGAFEHKKGFKKMVRFAKDYETMIKMQSFFTEWAIECLRVLKPGGFLLAFGGTRTYHRLVCGIEDAGFEIRDTIMWLYGSGFPKSLNIGKQIDKLNGKKAEEFKELGKYLFEHRKKYNLKAKELAELFPSKTGGLTGCYWNWENGMNVPTKEQWIILKDKMKLGDKFDYIIEREEAERDVIGKKQTGFFEKNKVFEQDNDGYGKNDITIPRTNEAKKWEGWGTALKPAVEPIVVARKPLSEKNVALNVLKWGTGGINVDGCRIGMKEGDTKKGGFGNEKIGFANQSKDLKRNVEWKQDTQGRFPANIILDEEAGKMLDEQSGVCSKGHFPKDNTKGTSIFNTQNLKQKEKWLDKGGASRFFYCAKASKKERNAGCEGLEDRDKAGKNFRPNHTEKANKGEDGNPYGRWGKIKNNHPTVKPIALMQYLVRLVTKKGGIVLDPFLGSGTTAIACRKEGMNYIGIEKDEDYCKIAEARIKPFMEQERLL